MSSSRISNSNIDSEVADQQINSRAGTPISPSTPTTSHSFPPAFTSATNSQRLQLLAAGLTSQSTTPPSFSPLTSTLFNSEEISLTSLWDTSTRIESEIQGLNLLLRRTRDGILSLERNERLLRDYSNDSSGVSGNEVLLRQLERLRNAVEERDERSRGVEENGEDGSRYPDLEGGRLNRSGRRILGEDEVDYDEEEDEEEYEEEEEEEEDANGNRVEQRSENLLSKRNQSRRNDNSSHSNNSTITTRLRGEKYDRFRKRLESGVLDKNGDLVINKSTFVKTEDDEGTELDPLLGVGREEVIGLFKLAPSTPISSSTRPKRPRPSSPTQSTTNKRLLTPTPELNNLHLTELTTSTIEGGLINMTNATKLYGELIQEWKVEESKNSGEKVLRLLSLLKIELSELGLLFPTLEDSSKLDVNALTTAREILEIGAFQSIRSQDVPAFERYLSLLGTYYSDLSKSLPRSVNEAPLVSLSLLRLLSQNRIAEFHTLLETLSKDVLDSTEVTWVISLERSLMEGSYSKVWRLCSPSTSPHSTHNSNLPRPEFSFFVKKLVETVRGEIANCHERAYTSLAIGDAKTLLFFENEGEVREFSKERNWYIDTSSTVHFPSSSSHPSSTTTGNHGIPKTLASGTGTGLAGAAGSDKEMNKERVITATLNYAKELESVV